MRLLIRTLVTLLSITFGGSLVYAVPPYPCTSAPEYRALLEHIAEAARSPSADFDALISEVPIECRLEVGGKRFQILTTQIHSQLFAIKSAEAKERAGKIKRLQKTLALRTKSLDGYWHSVDPTRGPKLARIFARPEFKNVTAQDGKAILREQFMRLMIALFSLIVKNPEQAMLFAKTFTWTCGILVALLVLWKLYRWLTKAAPVRRAPREILPFAPSAKAWQRWMAEAREALARGDLREAVHSSYWAAISHLESSGAWIPDKARTPREYLRLLSRSDPARPVLAEISRVFETVWYGERIPAEAECKTFLERVETIACR